MTSQATAPRLVRLPADFFSAFRRSLSSAPSGLDAETLLRRTGVDAGNGLWDVLESRLTENSGEQDAQSLSADDFWETLSVFCEDLGWGSLRHHSLHPGVGSLESFDWMEAEAAGDLGQPGCHFTTGMLAELLRRLVDDDVAVMEVECRSAGDDRCRFLIGGLATLENVCDQLRAGARYSESLAGLA